jgi:DNA-binding MarR family transcriptional regulator
MQRDARGIHLPTSVGYLLKEVSSALRVEMEAVLRPMGMTITHYACLELLAQRPGCSSSDLARGTFVTRQSMHVLLLALERDGLVERSDPEAGRAVPIAITAAGGQRLHGASAAVRSVEERMLVGLDDAEETTLRALLQRCGAGLRGDAPADADAGEPTR